MDHPIGWQHGPNSGDHLPLRAVLERLQLFGLAHGHIVDVKEIGLRERLIANLSLEDWQALQRPALDAGRVPRLPRAGLFRLSVFAAPTGLAVIRNDERKDVWPATACIKDLGRSRR